MTGCEFENGTNSEFENGTNCELERSWPNAFGTFIRWSERSERGLTGEAKVRGEGLGVKWLGGVTGCEFENGTNCELVHS